MGLGFAFAASISLLLWFGKAQLFQGAVLPVYLLLALLFAVVGGMQLNIESGWIGDLVPRNRLGWFTSLKWILSVIGMFVFVFTIARVADSFPTRAGYASIYGLFAFSFLCAATLIYPRVTDRIPRPANYFSAGPSGHDRLNYKSLPFRCYAAYLVLWAGGRTVFFAFTNVYLIHHFKMSLTGIASLQAIQYAASIIAIYCFGRIADRLGSRIPLLWITGIVGASMVLYPASAWLGVTAIVAFQFVNGLAGHGHGMLLINYGLEIFPDKGRAAYIGVSRALGGIASILSPILGGGLAYLLGDFHLTFLNADLDRYHIIFLISMLITLSGLIPLFIASNRTVREA